MFAAGKTAAVSGETPDAQFNYVTMLLHGDGTNGAQNNTFVDSSTNNFTITRNGNTTQGSFSPYGSNWGNFFDGSADTLKTASSSAFAMTGDFTMECWAFPLVQTQNYPLLFHFDSSSTAIQYDHDDAPDKFSFVVNDVRIAPSATQSPNAWYHIAGVRSGSTCTLYINGVSVATMTNSASLATSAVYIGGNEAVSSQLAYNGYLSNIRIVKGTAVYTSNFTPSTTPLTAISGTSLLTCQSNRFVDNSSNAFALTTTGTPSVQRFNPFGASTAYSTSVIGGSGYFDGSGDYLTAPDNTALDLSGDFTVEAWVNVDNVSSEYCVFHNHTSNTNGIALTVNSGAPRLLSGNGSWQVILDSSITIKPNTWNHIAGTRSGNTYTIWVNGVSGGTASNSSTPTYSGGAQIGRLTSGVPIAYIGYMSNLRVVKGTAVYTTTFTPSTTPLTAISGTSLLLEMTNGAIFDNAMMNDLETVGNAQISTSVKKYGTGSLKFDGTGDYLKTQYSPNTQLGAGNFTIEFWIYFNSVAADQEPLAGYDQNSVNWGFYLLSSGTLNYYLSSNGGTWDIASGVSVGSVSTGQWYHVALVRNGSTFTPYLNGVAGTTATSSSAIYSNSQGVYIGGLPSGYEFNGYIDDLRITKGYARYTANFTPPTAAFSNTGP